MVNGTADAVGRTRPPATNTMDPSDLNSAAAALGTEMVRFGRLIAAWKQHAKYDAGAADRVLLARLVVGGDRRATDLAADAFLDLSTVSRQVRSLVERGLVARHRDPEDKRGSLLSATESGRARFEQYRRERDTQLAALLEEWPQEDRAELIRLMARLNKDLAEQHSRQCLGGDQGTTEEHGDNEA